MTSDTYLSQLKILYVEDDDDTREDLRHYLRKKTGRVLTASSGTEGLRKYAEEHPDIVIADRLLPGMSGIDMLKAIRAAGGKAPFIITSSVDSSDTIIEAVETGIVRYVLKPIILDDLLDVLNKTAAELCSGSIVFDDIEKKLELESRIRQALTAYLKKTVGKGPRDLTVFISSERIEISAYGMLTPIEKKIMEDRHNVGMIEHLHGIYYRTAKPELESLITDITGFDAELSHTEFNTRRAIDSLVFTLTKK